jgi:hypothetical protein
MARNLWNLYALFLRGKKNTTNSSVYNLPQTSVSSIPVRQQIPVINKTFILAGNPKTPNSEPLLCSSVNNHNTSKTLEHMSRSKSNDSYFNNHSEQKGGGQKNRDNKNKKSFKSDEILPIGILLFAGGSALQNLNDQQHELDEVEARLWNQPSSSEPEVISYISDSVFFVDVDSDFLLVQCKNQLVFLGVLS